MFGAGIKMIRRKLISHSKPLIPVLIGMCLGVALSLVLAPVSDDCPVHSNARDVPRSRVQKVENLGQKRKTNSFINERGVQDYGNGDDFEPRVKPAVIVPGAKPPGSQKMLRPRYASTELGIKEKLFIGVLTTKETIDTLGVAINKTVTHQVPKLVFFMNMRGETLPPGMSVVIFSDDKAYQLPFHMFKYIQDHYVKTFDWFFFMPDTTYLKSEKLLEIVTHLSISHHQVYLGAPQKITEEDGAAAESGYCEFGNGILLSQPVMEAIVKNLDRCSRSIATPMLTHSENIGECIKQSTTLTCKDYVADKTFNFYTVPQFDFTRDVQLAVTSQTAVLKSSLTVHKLIDDVNMYKLHRYHCEHRLNQTRQELAETKAEIVNTAPKTPGGRHSLPWPAGVDPPAPHRNHFDILRWDFFTETHMYPDGDFHNAQELKGVDKEDMRDVIKTSFDRLNQKYQQVYSSVKLINGYRRFNPVRGMEYTLDLSLKKKGSKSEIHKRVHLMRPLSFVEIVPMPYVTESSKLNLVLPVRLDERDDVVSFLDSYAHTCLDSGDYTYLYIVFIYNQTSDKVGAVDPFAVLKSMVTLYESRYQNGAKIAWTPIYTTSPTQFSIMDTISRKFPSESLFLICTVGMELSIEFLNRVRMNTISNWQVFFPIGFWQYKPNLVYEEKPYPTTIEINRNVGHFDSNVYVHASFYNSDYQYARKQMISTSASHIDLYEMFLKFHSVHVFRAIEPALKLRFKERVCKPTPNEDHYQLCLKSRSEGLASRSQLAMLIFEQQQKLDRNQMNVIHQQNVEQHNVGQMKPNMLR